MSDHHKPGDDRLGLDAPDHPSHRQGPLREAGAADRRAGVEGARGAAAFYFGLDGKPAPRDILRDRPHGRIAFDNTDLAGAADHRNSIREADRAVRKLPGA